jgi:hypothetical protein
MDINEVRKRLAQLLAAETVPDHQTEPHTRACYVVYFASVTLLLIECVMAALR